MPSPRGARPGALPRQGWGGRRHGGAGPARTVAKSLRRKPGDGAANPARIVDARGAGYRMARPGEPGAPSAACRFLRLAWRRANPRARRATQALRFNPYFRRTSTRRPSQSPPGVQKRAVSLSPTPCSGSAPAPDPDPGSLALSRRRASSENSSDPMSPRRLSRTNRHTRL